MAENDIIFEFAAGTNCVFDTHGGDSRLNERSGQNCVIVRHLTEDEADMFDVGPMYHIRFDDGYETDAFEDELTAANGGE